jgi:hypothetical protein
MKKITFEQHLDKLAEHYGEDYSKVPTVDQILQGSYRSRRPLTITQSYTTSQLVFAHILTMWAKFGSKPNVIVDQYLLSFYKFLSRQPVEILVAMDRVISQSEVTFKEVPKDMRKIDRTIRSTYGG